MTSQFYSCSFEDVYIGSVRDGPKRTGTPFPFFIIQRESRLTFTRLIITLKQLRPECTKMHHCQIKKMKKKFWEGHTPSPDQSPLPFGASALGVPVPFHLQLEHCI